MRANAGPLSALARLAPGATTVCVTVCNMFRLRFFIGHSRWRSSFVSICADSRIGFYIVFLLIFQLLKTILKVLWNLAAAQNYRAAKNRLKLRPATDVEKNSTE